MRNVIFRRGWLWIDGKEGPPFFLAAVVGVEDVMTAILDLADYVQE